MSQQGDAFVRRVLKGDPTPLTFEQNLAYLRHMGGSGRGAARLAGKGESTLRDWASGRRHANARSQADIAAKVRELRSRPSKMGDPGVILPIVSRDRKRGKRERDISGAQLALRPGTLDAAHQIWVSTGDADAAARRFVEGIGEPWYHDRLNAALDSEAEYADYDDSAYGMSIA